MVPMQYPRLSWYFLETNNEVKLRFWVTFKDWRQIIL